jgi:DNA-binding NtrC family response regulator
MQAVFKEIGRIASKPVTVLVTGETGTGKELVARALWQHGGRRDKPFIAVNCAAIPPHLVESELFGHERGAFTGADSRRIGRFEQADGGTLLLDEIADLALEIQAKLLRVLQERRIARIGGRDEISVDVKVIAATHRDIRKMVGAGQFREDLWYRINVAEIALPPLRERREDIPDLVNHFVLRYGQELGAAAPLQPSAMKFLSAQPWTGNVRELENVVKRSLLLARGFAITEEIARSALTTGHVPALSREKSAQTIAELCDEALANARKTPALCAAHVLFTVVERELLGRAYAATGGNLSQMSHLIGWSRLTIREKLKLHKLRP